jgi:hypothetical protein
MRIMKIWVVVSTLLVSVPSKAVVILVHGSFARSSKWWQPGGSFFQELESDVASYHDRIVPFAWSGALGHTAKIRAATFLAKLILSYSPGERIILVGHSHGGNVINLASHLVSRAISTWSTYSKNNTDAQEQSLISHVGESVTEALKYDVAHEEKRSRLFSTLLLAYHDVASFYKERRDRAIIRVDAPGQHESEQLAPENEKLPFLIERIYLLGTPVNSTLYLPHMNVIQSVYNLYSKGDSIQRVFGLYERRYRNIERIVNLRILFQTAIGKNSYYNPSHNETHDALIGMWLLRIPSIFREYASDTADMGDGCIKFHRNGDPVYEPTVL